MSFFRKIFRTQDQSSKPITDSLFYSHRNKIYPWVKVIIGEDDPDDEPVLELSAEESPISKNWLGDLAIYYVADMDTTFQIIQARDLPNDISEDQLHQIAIENLNRDIEYKLHDTNFGGYGLIAGGDHEAGSICLPGIWEWLAEHLGDNLIVGIPTKDLVILVPESDTDKISNLKIFVHQMFKDGKRLLTRNIFKYDRLSKNWAIIDNVR